jgi:hypothetical protein
LRSGGVNSDITNPGSYSEGTCCTEGRCLENETITQNYARRVIDILLFFFFLFDRAVDFSVMLNVLRII